MTRDKFIVQASLERSRAKMAGSTSLVNQFDEIIAATDVLCAGSEGVFAQFVGHQIGFYKNLETMKDENSKLKSEKEAQEIKLKHARSSFDYQMQKRAEAEENLKEYQRQFTIIAELLSDNKLNTLNDEERRSLAFLKRRRSSCSPGRSFMTDSSIAVSPSELSIDPGEVDMDVSVLRNGTKWKRRRTGSVDKVTQETTPPKKRKRSDEEPVPPLTEEAPRTKSSLSPKGDLHMVPRLDGRFKKPPPHKNRRRPSKAHLHQMAEGQSSDEVDSVVSPNKGEALFLDDGAPSAPPLLSPRIYPELPPTSDTTESDSPPVTTPLATPRSQSDINMQRRHTFFTKTVIRMETCQVCNKKIKFSKNCLKCRDCRTVCHPECRNKVPLPCVPCVPTPKKKNMTDADLASFCPQTIPRVPAIVIHCVNEIERRGLTDVGLYRVPGSDRAVKELMERLLRAKGKPTLDQVHDINVICGVLKVFFRSLREPLLTYRMHKTFTQATEAESDEEGLATTLEAIAELPPSNKDTLAFLILHLQKVASYSAANKMPIASLAKVFGPTIVGHATPNPDPSVMWQDIQKQPKVLTRLLGISSDYWRQYLSPMDNPEPLSPTPSVQSSPGVISPATPELRPIPESPFLGSCQSPKSRAFAGRTPLKIRASVVANKSAKTKRTGSFFAALN